MWLSNKQTDFFLLFPHVTLATGSKVPSPSSTMVQVPETNGLAVVIVLE